MRTNFAIIAAVFCLTSTTPALAKGKAPCGHEKPAKIQTGLATDKGYKLSPKMPKMKTRPTVKAKTWADQEEITQIQPRRLSDPYLATLKGYHNGAKYEIHQETMAEAIAIPQDERKIIPNASQRKKANRAYNKAFALAVAKSERSKVLHAGEIGVNGPAFEEQINKPEELAVGAPLKVLAKDRFGRKYAVATTNAEPLATSTLVANEYIGNSRYKTVRRGGQFAPQGAGWIQAKNLFSTPAFEKDGQTFAKILGIKAFAPGSKVVIKNLRMIGEGQDQKASQVEFIAKKGSTPNHGVGGVFVPGMQDDLLEISVQLPDSRADAVSYKLRIPKMKGRPDISARGVKYFRIEKPIVDEPAAQLAAAQ